MTDETRVEWRSWGPDAFAEARATDKPVLLSLTATWCEDCHEMDAETYAEPRIAANLNDGFVPIRVDVDRHPRIRERYNMGGFPSTVFLAPDGHPITGATFIGPEGMRQVIDRVREVWEKKGSDAGRTPRALAGDLPPAGEVSPQIEAHLAGQLEVNFDESHGGWGDAAKFPLPRTVEFALKRDQQRALRTLDAIRDGLFDPVEGGFFRYADDAAWTKPNREKTLESNAALLRAFANGYRYTGEEAYRDPAVETAEFLVESLWTGTGFGGSMGPASGTDYYLLGAEGRASAPGPRTDLTVYAGGNALAVDALLVLSGLTDHEQAREFAARTLDRIAEDLVEDGVVTHFHSGGDVGESLLLEDHARVVTAACRARQVLGDGTVAGESYLDFAAAVADAAIDELFVDDSFLDGPASGEALLSSPLRPLDGNAEMANALLDLAALTDDDTYRDVAETTIGAFAGAWDRIGVQVAEYGTAAARLLRDPILIELGDEAWSDLHRAALRVADHEALVVPEADVTDGVARVSSGTTSVEATTPDELMQAVSSVTPDA
ncbi:thioredoxin domain-containing protein [Haloferax mediterranei ATCC 33500]|nr:DUF255 domain-containing protein [Haloferax mediterranei]AFK20046.2 hypothetical protein HFX_2359 [Haloferax mediterranei ATCC 33500]AHZ23424.1 hypothetical protein BM92_12585 [Haloferax mediterranei ATCC 33500]MDX5987202.1 DUF255 domain-containing protein [Haloferax mediterranei ATCC 33500]QCQ76507.1 thioredoxin domain-containing protein [Haloferax mediterranei ATCC 33500]